MPVSDIKIKDYNYFFFLGIGGIGMSALARFFNAKGKKVAGYDKTQTVLTKQLEQEGMLIHYHDDIKNIPSAFMDKTQSLIIYTPAIPHNNTELNYFQEQKFNIIKRAAVLGIISKEYQTIAVAGTHGKTTISTMTTHLLSQSELKANGFVGGISKNFDSNFILAPDSDIVVTEADEFDRSFLQLYPQIALISSMDADHLDIYGTKNDLQDSFFEFVSQIKPNGYLVHKKGLNIPNRKNIHAFSYDINNSKADFYAYNIQLETDLYRFDLHTPDREILNLKLGVPGWINVENAVGASALAILSGIKDNELRKGLENYQGVKRRFDYRIKTSKIIYIDDYAHHPEELKAIINSVKSIYPNKIITGIFQPHLYTRTRDFVDGFAQSLSLLDKLFLLDIYPARELPIKGIDASIIFDKVDLEHKELCTKENILDHLKNLETDVLLTLGAGDIDQLVPQIEKLLK